VDEHGIGCLGEKFHMTLAEFLQQLVAAQSPLFILRQTIGGPTLVASGEVWTGQGGLLVYNNGKTLGGICQLT